MNDAKLIAIREEAERALARTSLVDFAKRMIPGFEDPGAYSAFLRPTRARGAWRAASADD